MHTIYYQALLTHENLTEDERKWLVSHLHFSINPARTIILSYLLSVTGHYAIKYNMTLENIAHEKNEERLKKLYNLTFDESYPELKMLSDEERKIIRKRINKEYSAIKNLMKNDHHSCVLPRSYEEMGSTPYCNEFRSICFHDDDMEYTPSLAPNKIYIRDNNIYCFSRNELINRFLEGNFDNPLTNQPFSKGVLQELSSSLALDIKLRSEE